MTRTALIERLARVLGGLRPHHPLRVAIDGVDAAGKTHMRDEIAAALAAGPRELVCASADDFLHPRSIRYRQGALSPEGYYQDSVDYGALRRLLLEPLGPGGTRRYQTAAFDHGADRPTAPPPRQAPPDGILLVDGVFLLAPAIRELWDYVIFVAVHPRTSMERMIARDAARLGGAGLVRQRCQQRYLPGQRLYLRACNPQARADVVIRNDHLHQPHVRWRR